MKGLAVGRVVHYVAYGTPNGEYKAGAHRAAIIAEIKDAESGECVLTIFNPTGLHWNTAEYSEKSIPGTWHFPERI